MEQQQKQQEQIQKIFESFIFKHGLYEHQVQSFNYLMTDIYPQIIEENKRVEVTCEATGKKQVITFFDYKICRPMFFESDGTVHDTQPDEAILRKASYSNSIMLNIHHATYECSTDKLVPPVETKVSSDLLVEDVLKPNIVNCGYIPPTPGTEEYECKLIDEKIYKETTPFRMATMLGSNFDQNRDLLNLMVDGHLNTGVFCVNGNEKVVLPQERQRYNYPHISYNKNYNYWVCEIRSWNSAKFRSTSTLYAYLHTTKKNMDTPIVTVELPFLKKYFLPLNHLFRLLGVDDIKKMRQIIVAKQHPSSITHQIDTYMKHILKHQDMPNNNLDEIRQLILNKYKDKTMKLHYVDALLRNEFLPHLGLQTTPRIIRKKLIYLGREIFRMLVLFSERNLDPLEKTIAEDSKDHYINKRLETVHVLFGLQFRQSWRAFKQSLSSVIHKKMKYGKEVDVKDILKASNKISKKIKQSLNVGRFTHNKNQTGVAQSLIRMTSLAHASHLRRVNLPINRSGKAPQPRQLHPSCFGFICASESPEGEPCGLVKNLAILTHVRIGFQSEAVLSLLQHDLLSFDTCPADQLYLHTWVYFNGDIVGLMNKSSALDIVKKWRRWRRVLDLPFDLSITYHEKTQDVILTSDAGCLMRPVFLLENIHKLPDLFRMHQDNPYMLWDELVHRGVIEYLDFEEQSTMRIAEDWYGLKTDPQPETFTHIEIHPCVIMGLCANLIPYSNDDQAPRVSLGSTMEKQGVGIPHFNIRNSYLNSSVHMLCQPQKPIVSTMVERVTGFDEKSYGENVVVAISIYGGTNQEDSVIFNKRFIDLTGFSSLHFQTFKEAEKLNGTEKEEFRVPNKKETVGIRSANYDKLHHDEAVVGVGELIEEGDILIGKVSVTTDKQSAAAASADQKLELVRDRSVLYKSKESARVDSVIETTNKDNKKMIHARLCSYREPEVGDKFCLTGDHEVLTAEGWKRLDLLRKTFLSTNKQEFVLSFHPSTNELSWQEISDFHYFQLKNELLYSFFETGECSAVMTSEHRLWLYDYQEQKAVDMPLSSIYNLKTGKLVISNNRYGLYHHTTKFSASEENDAFLEECLRPIQFSLLYFYKCSSEQFAEHAYTIQLKAQLILYYYFAYCDNTSTFVGGKIEHAHEYIESWMKRRTLVTPVIYCLSRTMDPHLLVRLFWLAYIAGWAADYQKNEIQVYAWSKQKINLPCRVNSVRSSLYDNEVMCIETKHHNFLIRHRNCISWTGNSSRHGQKGVISAIYAHEDMPTSASGITPDIIINPHGYPGRMTIGQLIEMLHGKAACLEGKIGNGSSFQSFGPDGKEISIVDELGDILVRNNMNRHGKEVLINGMTGATMTCDVFMGPIYYQKLKHMVIDKIHARDVGKRTANRQPVESRSKQGGLKFGEMEVAAMISHGAPNCVLDRLLYNSDKFETVICTKCGQLADPVPAKPHQYQQLTGETPRAFCRRCESSDHIKMLVIPYGFKTLVEYIGAGHISMTFSGKNVPLLECVRGVV